MKLVRPFINSCIAFWISTSVLVSTELVASSRIRIFGSARESPGDGQKLLLSLRDVAGLLVDLEIITQRQRPYKMVDVGHLRGGNHLVVGSVQIAVANVLFDCAVEQPCVLQYHAEHAAQVAGERIL